MNSIKYGVNRGITEIGIDFIEQNKILIRISDNGKGIDKEHLPGFLSAFIGLNQLEIGNKVDLD